MLKTSQEVTRQVKRRFDTSWATCACGGGQELWPYCVALGRPTQTELARNPLAFADARDELRAWCTNYGLELECEARRMGALQQVPVRVRVPNIDVAADVLGREACDLLATGRQRARELQTRFPNLGADDVMRVVRLTRAWANVDFTLLLDASTWFAANDARGLTPRQVPLEGFHAKWLDDKTRRQLVCLLSGKSELGLVDRPHELLFSYLDPQFLAEGGRRFNIEVEGFSHALQYAPRFVLIVENKDTYLWFPPTEGGVCVFGSGRSGAALCGMAKWIAEAPHIFYWGDMDADGLEILNDYRSAGFRVTSILMGMDAFRRHERFGTRSAKGRRQLSEHTRVDTPFLTDSERELYELLTDPTWKGALRIEQERIPFRAATDELRRLLDADL